MKFSRILFENDTDAWRSMPGETLHADTHESLKKMGFEHDGDSHTGTHLVSRYYYEDPYYGNAAHASQEIHNVLKEHGWERTRHHDKISSDNIGDGEPSDDFFDSQTTHLQHWRHPNGSSLVHRGMAMGSPEHDGDMMESDITVKALR